MSYKGVAEAIRTNDRVLLVEQFKNFIHKQAHHLIKGDTYNRLNYDDLVSEGKLSILKAYSRFDRSKYNAAQFLMYCTRYIKGMMNNKAREIWSEEADHVSMQSPVISEDGDSSRTLGDTIEDRRCVVTELENRDLAVQVDSIIERLVPEKDREIARLYLSGEPPRAIVPIVNKDIEHVRVVVYRSMDIIKRELKKGE